MRLLDLLSNQTRDVSGPPPESRHRGLRPHLVTHPAAFDFIANAVAVPPGVATIR